MSDKHEEFLRDIFGEHSSVMPNSGSGWAKQMDVRGKHRDEDFAFAVDGKALPLDTAIPTPDGWITMGDVEVDDQLFSMDGSICHVTALGPIYTPGTALEFTCRRGERVVADAQHRWPVVLPYTYHRRNRIISVRTGQQIREDVHRYGDRHFFALPVSQPIQTEEYGLLIDSYALGLWLGGGDSSCARITLNINEADDISQFLTKRGVEWHYQYPPSQKDSVESLWLDGMNPILSGLKILGDKHIPGELLRASYDQRLSLLRGLMDTDGTITKASGIATLTLTNHRLIKSARELLLTLGIRANIREERVIYRGKYRPKYSLSFSAPTNPFGAVTHKRNRWIQKSNPRYRSIVGVEEVSPTPMRCIQVDSPDSTYLVTEHFLPTHNSTLRESISVTRAMWDKAVDQSHNEIPALALRWYDDYQLTPGLDLVCVEAQTFKAMKEMAEENERLRTENDMLIREFGKE